MKAAVCYEFGKPFVIEELSLRPPRKRRGAGEGGGYGHLPQRHPRHEGRLRRYGPLRGRTRDGRPCGRGGRRRHVGQTRRRRDREPTGSLRQVLLLHHGQALLL